MEIDAHDFLVEPLLPGLIPRLTSLVTGEEILC